MRYKENDNYPPALEIVVIRLKNGVIKLLLLECGMTQEMCNKAVHRNVFQFDSIPDEYKTLEIYDTVVSLYPFSIVYCPDKYITQKCVMNLFIILLQH